jgi:hypothetical protein
MPGASQPALPALEEGEPALPERNDMPDIPVLLGPGQPQPVPDAEAGGTVPPTAPQE